MFEFYLAVYYFLRNLGMVSFEGRFAVTEFEEKDSEGPNVKLVIVRGIRDHFGGHVFESTAKRIASLFLLSLYAPAEVTDF